MEKDKQVGGNHYKNGIEPVDYILSNDMAFCEGNVVKYVTRHHLKNGAEDIRKAIHYLEIVLEKGYGVETGKGAEEQQERTVRRKDYPFEAVIPGGYTAFEIDVREELIHFHGFDTRKAQEIATKVTKSAENRYRTPYSVRQDG